MDDATAGYCKAFPMTSLCALHQGGAINWRLPPSRYDFKDVQHVNS